MPTDPGEELKALRGRLEKLRRLHAETTAKAEAAGALLAKPSTFPKARKDVQRELETAAIFNLPMLEGEIDKAQREIAALERPPDASTDGGTEPVVSPLQEDDAARARCAAIADALAALRKRAVYARELAASSQAGTLDVASLSAERERAEQGVREIEGNLAEVERAIAATNLALRDLVMQRAPDHMRMLEGDTPLMAEEP